MISLLSSPDHIPIKYWIPIKEVTHLPWVLIWELLIYRTGSMLWLFLTISIEYPHSSTAQTSCVSENGKTCRVFTVTINLMIRWNFSSWKCMLDVADEVSKHKNDKNIVYHCRHLNGHSRHYRQTIMLSTFADAGWNSETCMREIRFTYDSIFTSFL